MKKNTPGENVQNNIEFGEKKIVENIASTWYIGHESTCFKE